MWHNSPIHPTLKHSQEFCRFQNLYKFRFKPLTSLPLPFHSPAPSHRTHKWKDEIFNYPFANTTFTLPTFTISKFSRSPIPTDIKMCVSFREYIVRLMATRKTLFFGAGAEILPRFIKFIRSFNVVCSCTRTIRMADGFSLLPKKKLHIMLEHTNLLTFWNRSPLEKKKNTRASVVVVVVCSALGC